ncbi:hypothetical protein BCR42DRAFT_409350, partial [Absidia repens]
MTSHFETERDKLMEGISQSLEQLVGSLEDLNQNLETVNTIGKGFEASVSVWHQFHKSVMTPDNLSNTKTETMKEQKNHGHDILPIQPPAQDESRSTTR